MNQISELYQKVAADPSLQAKFAEIMQDAEVAGKAETDANLLAFAKEAGFDVTMEEAGAFFAKLAEKTPEGELSEVELDMVAGGKSDDGKFDIIVTVCTVGIVCGLTSLAKGGLVEGVSACSDLFQ